MALEDLLVAPFTSAPCVAWGAQVAVSGENADIQSTTKSIRFKLDDGTGGIELGPGFLWQGKTTLEHSEGDTPSDALVEQVRRLFPIIEDRSAGGNLATSGMSCSEEVLREGASFFVAGNIVQSEDKMQFRTEEDELKCIVSPTHSELADSIRANVRTHWRLFGVIAGVAAILPLLLIVAWSASPDALAPITFLGLFAYLVVAILLSFETSV